MTHTSARLAAYRPALAFARRACGAICRWAFSFTGGSVSNTIRNQAQDRAAQNIALLMARRHDLMAERELLTAARAKALRQHKRVSISDARLREITAELLSIG